MKEKNVLAIIGSILICIGLIYILIGSLFCAIFFITARGNTISAQIIRITSEPSKRDSYPDVYVEYTYNDEVYRERLNAYSSTFREGDIIEIVVDRDNPKKVTCNFFSPVFFIFPVLGLLLVIIGTSLIIYVVKKKKYQKRLKEEGQIIYADYVETKIINNYQVNGKRPYRIVCSWNNTLNNNEKMLFESNNIWSNPEKIIRDKNIIKIRVYLDPDNYKKYLVDIDDILNSLGYKIKSDEF